MYKVYVNATGCLNIILNTYISYTLKYTVFNATLSYCCLLQSRTRLGTKDELH
jgi:hypothetical protein